MEKKYITTIEDIEALRNTDTKIYRDNHQGYFKFVNGVLCKFDDDGDIRYNDLLLLTNDPNYERHYIEVEEPVKEATKKDIGKLCKFFGTFDPPFIGILAGFTYDRRPIRVGGNIYKKCYRLTPAEVAEITGYKVEE